MAINIFDIQTIEDFYEYIEIELGAPVIHQEMSIKHLDHAIKKAIQYYISNTGINSTDQKVIKLKVDKNNVNNIILDSSVTNVESIHIKPVGSGGVFDTGVIFDSYSLRNLQYETSSGFNLIGFEIYSQYMSLIQNHFMDGQIFKFNPETGKIIITPTPKIGDEIIMVVDMHFDWNSPLYFNNLFIQQLAVAWAKYYWGFILQKYGDREISGGINVNAGDIFTEGKDSIKELEEKFKEENSFSSYFTMG